MAEDRIQTIGFDKDGNVVRFEQAYVIILPGSVRTEPDPMEGQGRQPGVLDEDFRGMAGHRNGRHETAGRIRLQGTQAKSVEIVAAIDNAASQRVAQKAGALREGIMRNRFLIQDRVSDGVMFPLVPTEIPFLNP